MPSGTVKRDQVGQILQGCQKIKDFIMVHSGVRGKMMDSMEEKEVGVRSETILSTDLDRLEIWWPLGKAAIYSADSALSDVLVLINKNHVDFSKGYDWGMDFPQNDATNKLYLHSLAFIGQLVHAYEKTKDERYLSKGISLFRSWNEFYMVNGNRDRIGKMRSADHAMCFRVLVLISLMQCLNKVPTKEDIPLKEMVGMLYDHGRWLEEDSHHAENNHGLMTDLALLMASLQFSVMPSLANRWRDKATQRLEMMVVKSFTEEGINVENTPGYHGFNLRLYSNVVEVMDHYQVKSNFQNVAKPILKMAKDAFRHMLRQDRYVPPIGDWGVALFKDEVPLDKSIWYPKSGYAFVKTDDIYLSVRCGFNKLFHKHVDDSSITLRYKGEDILVDGGYFNYDRTDRFRRYFESSGAHTGIFPQEMEEVGPLDLGKSKIMDGARLTRFQEGEEGVLISCSYKAMGRIDVSRTIWFLRPNVVLLADRVSSAKEISGVRQQFLFGPDVEIKSQGVSGIAGHVKKVNFHLVQHLPVGSFDPSKGRDDTKVRGWYSTGYMVKQPIHQIDFVQEGMVTTYLTSIVLDSGNDDEWESVRTGVPSMERREVEIVLLRAEGKVRKALSFNFD
jgi:hypothetical protein